MHISKPINLQNELQTLKLLEHRTPHSTSDEKMNAFSNLSNYRDGAIYIGYFNGESDWERHNSGDEIVWILEGVTTLFMIIDGQKISHSLSKDEFIVVPQNTWHRFVTQGPIKSLTVTPAPTDHTTNIPQSV